MSDLFPWKTAQTGVVKFILNIADINAGPRESRTQAVCGEPLAGLGGARNHLVASTKTVFIP